MKRRMILVLAVALSIVGCASTMSTPIQKATWEAGRLCHQNRYFWQLHVQWVKPDGEFEVYAQPNAMNPPPSIALQQVYETCILTERARLLSARVQP